MNKGFGILSMFVLIIIFALCLFLSAYSYQRFMSNEKDNYVNDIPTLKSENKTNVIKPMYDYKVLEDKLNNASLKYINENNLEDSISNIKECGEDKVLSRNPEEQKWYYTSVYKSCIENVDANHPIFVRYKKVLEELWK